MLKLIKNDPWLKPYTDIIEERFRYILNKESLLTDQGKADLSEYASGYNYFGFHKTADSWVLREWAPNAKDIYLIGTFNDWKKDEACKMHPIGNGNWELNIPLEKVKHGDLFKIIVCWDGGEGERIPAWATRVVQDKETNIFSAQVWDPADPYVFKSQQFKPDTDPLLIYESHIGMATEDGKVGTYNEFRQNILPRIKDDGYNTVQIMAIQEHPYYGSFGYHVSNFFAPSSRFGTPDELKCLIDEAHSMGLAVIMDIVHSHAAKNEVEGLGRFDGSYDQYFHKGSRREHSVWDSLCFDYGKPEVLHFLLSNCKYWLEVYHFDGFRFDGVTSMIYLNHGLNDSFGSYQDYYKGNEDADAIAYLTLANKLIHQVKPDAITIAEEVSGMPGIAVQAYEGGYGFDYRMAMNIPDYWIKMIKEKRDEDWRPSNIFWEMTNRRNDEKTISYTESHDQALVGDKTIIFRLIDSDMYWYMSKLYGSSSKVERGLALHKMIRLVTFSTINGGYLNFMGNEFGHPEWIDFPREGNRWSYEYARRQWHLVDDCDLRYHYLGDFDRAMLSTMKKVDRFEKTPIIKLCDNDGDQVMAYMRGEMVFVFNFNPIKSFTDYGFLAPEGKYNIILNTDAPCYGGHGLVDETIEHFTQSDKISKKVKQGMLKIYIPARTAFVLKKTD